MDRNAIIMISTAVCSIVFFACNTVMPKIIYHGLRFEE